MRRHPDPSGNLILDEGDYGIKDGIWYVRPPGQHMGSLEKHKVTEHKDGTITVVPSILITCPPTPPWHGHLIKGEFIEVKG